MREFSRSIDRYCAKPQSHLTQMVMNRIEAMQGAEFCGEVMYYLSQSDDAADEYV